MCIKKVRYLLIYFFLFKHLPTDSHVIRIMTNINALVQQSCSVFTRGKNATDGKFIKKLLGL